MTLDWLPDATRDAHARSFPWAEQTDPKGCLHTTESSSWPEYRGWTVMPHATVLPTPGKGVTVRQHLPFSQGSFALRHTRTQPTNGDYVFQFELIGTSEKGGPGLFWADADDAVLLDLYKKVIAPLDAAYVIPFRALAFEAYPASYGTTNGVRLTDSQFDTYSGWLGHQHVPQNDHGDPGAFPWARLLAVAGQQPPNPPGPGKLDVDGVLGAATIRRWQTYLNGHGAKPHLDVDGQLGPATWRAVDVWLGVTPANGVPGRDTVRALQRKVGSPADGILGADTIRALQRWLNNHR
jgi:hypothetical protein